MNNLYSILNNQSVPLQGNINPTIQQEINTYVNKNPTFPVNPTIQNYNWLWKYFSIDLGRQYPKITSDIFNYANLSVASQILTSDNGNLSVLNLDANVVHLFRANLFFRQGKTTTLNFGWTDSILVNINGTYLTSNSENSQFNNTNTNINFSAGWNIIEIYTYTTNPGVTFTINNQLGQLVDLWGTPTIQELVPPQNFSLSIATDLVGKKDPNTNILGWSQAGPSFVYGYKIYRNGPYNSGIQIPQIILFSTGVNYSSGWLTSGLPGIQDNYGRYPDPYYTITASDTNGEGLPLNQGIIPDYMQLFGIPSVSGYPVNSVGANLGVGNYTYNVIAKILDGRYIDSYGTSNFTVQNNVNNATQISWFSLSGAQGITGYDIFRQSGVQSNLGSFSGQYLATVNYDGNSYLDSGINGTLVTGITFARNNNSFFSNEPVIYYLNNSYALYWSGVPATDSGVVTYNVYRTLYSGNYSQNSLVAQTTGLFFIDSGIFTSGSDIPMLGQPITFNNIGSVNYGTSTYKDVGVLVDRTYDYYITAFDHQFIESLPTSTLTITAGDNIAPSTPSGITVTSLNGFATIGWQNGKEPDLDQTIVYESDTGPLGSYYEIGRTSSNSFIRFIGYSGVPYFELANIDTSENISPLSSPVNGSGNLVANNVIMTSFSTLSTQDLDLDYYLPSGINRDTHGILSSKMLSIIANPGTIFDSSWGYSILKSSTSTGGGFPEISGITQSSDIFSYGALDSFSTNLSGISTILISNGANTGQAQFEHNAMMCYYSGVPSNRTTRLHWHNYNYNISTHRSSYQTIGTSLTGINVGNYINGNPQLNTAYPAYPKPLFVANQNDVSNNNVIVFISGNSTDQLSFGFANFNYAGSQTGICKYFNIPNNNLSPAMDYSAAFDPSGNLDIVWNGNPSPGQVVSMMFYYKININKDNNNPITIVASGQYPQTISAVQYGGGLMPFSYLATIYNNSFFPRMFYDKQNYLNIFFLTNVAVLGLKQVGYMRMNSDGSTNLSLTSLYQLPFQMDVNSWDVAYNPINDDMYSNYGLTILPNVYRNRVYTYLQGAYRRRHQFERNTDVSLYQIIQSTLK